MRKKIMKCFALLLSAALVLGSINYSSANVQAGNGEAAAVSSGDVSGGIGGDVSQATARYYTFNDVTETGGYQNTASVSEAGVLSIAYEAQYAEKMYTLPTGIDFSTLERIELDLSEGEASGIAIKLYVDGSQVDVNYWTYLDITADLSGATSVAIGIMNNAAEAASYTIDNIKITAVQTGGSETEPPTSVGGGNGGGEQTATARYYTFNDVTEAGGYQNTASVSEAGVLSIAYEAQYAEKMYNLPAGIDFSTLERIELDLSEGEAGGIALKLYVDGEMAEVNYWTYIDVTADLSAATTVGIGIMNNAAEAASYVIDNIKITAVQTGGSETEPPTSVGGGNEGGETAETARYYTFKDVTRTGGYGYTENITEAGVLELALNANYQEIQYSLPAGVDAATLKNITLDVSSGGTANLAIKLLVDGAQAAVVYGTNTIDITADLSAATSVGFAIMNKNETDDIEVVIDNIKITAVQTGGSETEPSTAVATMGTKYYTFKEVTRTGGYGYTEDISAAGVLTLGLNANYQEIQYGLPEGVDGTTLTNITLDVSSGGTENLAIKLLVDGAQAQVVYGTNTIDVTADLSAATSVGFAIMNKNETEDIEVVIDNIKITAVQTGGSDSEPSTEAGGGDESGETSKYYTFNDVSVTGGYGYTETVSNDGTLSLTLNANYQEIQYGLPAGVDATTLKKIVFDVAEGEMSYFCIKLLVDGAQKKVVYGNSTIEVAEADVASGTIGFAIMNTDTANPQEFTINSIKITAVQTGGSDTKPEGGAGSEPLPEGNKTPAAEAEEDKSWKGDVLEKTVIGYNECEATLVGDQWNVTYPSQYCELKLALPETIDISRCVSMTFVVSGQDEALAFKLYTAEGELWAQYGQSGKNLYKVTSVPAEGIITHIGVAHNGTGADVTAIFDGVYFDMLEEGVVIETYEKTFTADQLTLGSSNATTCELTDAGWAMTFGALNLETALTLPEAMDMSKCASITVYVSGQVGPVNFHIGADGAKAQNFWYNADKTSYALTPSISSKINQLLIQCGGETYTEGSAITIESIKFTMLGKEPLPAPEDDVYTPNYFEVEEKSAGVTVTEGATAEEPTVIEFATAGDSVVFAVPETVDLAHLVSIDFGIRATSTLSLDEAALPGVKIELLDADMEVLMETTTTAITTSCNPEVKYIRITSVSADVVIALDDIKFNIDENAFEAIVLNGNFQRDDVSMWSSAAYNGAVVTAKTGTDLPAGLTTYGEISGRTSNYNSFAQNVTARVEPGKTYSYIFYAKLSDDYIGASDAMRVVEFGPYYTDGLGNDVYGQLNIEGTSQQVLEPGVWTMFIGKVTVPTNATGFTIRIVEQGTNYGTGPGVMGDYYVTGVKLVEYIEPEKPAVYNPGAQAVGYSVTYTAEELMAENVAASTEIVDGKLRIYFNQQYAESKLKLPRALDMRDIVNIQVNVGDQTVNAAVKLYKKGVMKWVDYFNRFANGYGYTVVPFVNDEINQVGIMSLNCPDPGNDYLDVESITFNLIEEPDPIPVRTELVANGFFDGDDLSDWQASFWGDGVTMTQMVSDTPIFDNVYSYASYSRRTSPYQCFAQDLSGVLEQNEKYTFSFWARLSDDYIGAPEEQRRVQFSPYTVDKDGNPDYNPQLEGTYNQVLEPGVWTYFEGIYKVTNANEVGQVIIRILEQGTNYGTGDCVLGGYDIAGVVIEKYIPDPPSIDQDVPDLKDAITDVFGDDFIVGTAATVGEMDDIGVEMLINKHFNAVTIGNELKPDALFGYSNYEHTKLETIIFNGQELVVPTLDYSRAEMALDMIKEWNEAHPDEPIKVRGHVLVWHSQTPEWFFRENYVVGQNADGSENYVTPEVMNLRLEWFIKTVLEHFTGEDSEYKDMFYGWDVVNEAVGDGGNGYRTDKVANMELPSAATHSKNSSWWAVYQSNEYIIKAFQYANKYAPADVELYYNDYNDADSKKVIGIVALLKAVKEAEGTRIDGMGMQGHYNLFNPSNKAIESAIRAYAAVVGKVQYTELDFKASGDISNEYGLKTEYEAQAKRYHEIYELLKKLDKEEGIEITGLTIWGTVDHYSWLQSVSNVGGGSDIVSDQCPLLFDTNYKVKPAYWAFVDYTKVDPTWVPATEEETKTDDSKTDDNKTDDSKAEDDVNVDSSEVATDDTKESETADDTKDTTSGSSLSKPFNPWPIIIVAIVVVVAAAAVAAVMITRKKK